jgi:hypothetical protein
MSDVKINSEKRFFLKYGVGFWKIDGVSYEIRGEWYFQAS